LCIWVNQKQCQHIFYGLIFPFLYDNGHFFKSYTSTSICYWQFRCMLVSGSRNNTNPNLCLCNNTYLLFIQRVVTHTKLLKYY